MPCFRKREREDEGEVSKPVPKRRKREFQVMENIGYRDSHYHSLFGALPSQIEEVSKLIGQYVVSMLNSHGGIVTFGVRKTGIIYGEKISRREEDVLRCTIDEAIKRIHPCVRCDQYVVKFTPVMGKQYRDEEPCSRKVLEIKVMQGDPNELYQDQKHEAFARKGSSIVGPLTPHQIKDITIKKLKQKLRAESGLANVLSPRRPAAAGVNRPPPRNATNASGKQVEVRKTGEGHKEVAKRAISKETGSSGSNGDGKKSSLVTTVRKKIVVINGKEDGADVKKRVPTSRVSEAAANEKEVKSEGPVVRNSKTVIIVDGDKKTETAGTGKVEKVDPASSKLSIKRTDSVATGASSGRTVIDLTKPSPPPVQKPVNRVLVPATSASQQTAQRIVLTKAKQANKENSVSLRETIREQLFSLNNGPAQKSQTCQSSLQRCATPQKRQECQMPQVINKPPPGRLRSMQLEDRVNMPLQRKPIPPPTFAPQCSATTYSTHYPPGRLRSVQLQDRVNMPLQRRPPPPPPTYSRPPPPTYSSHYNNTNYYQPPPPPPHASYRPAPYNQPPIRTQPNPGYRVW